MPMILEKRVKSSIFFCSKSRKYNLMEISKKYKHLNHLKRKEKSLIQKTLLKGVLTVLKTITQRLGLIIDLREGTQEILL